MLDQWITLTTVLSLGILVCVCACVCVCVSLFEKKLPSFSGDIPHKK